MSNSNSPSMNIVIDAERQYKSNLNSDNFRNLYRNTVYIEDENSSLKLADITFVDFNNEFLDTYRSFILSQCLIKTFLPRWTYRPNYLSYDMYGTQMFTYILMYINDVTSVIDFKMDYVKVPTVACLRDLAIDNQRLYPNRNNVQAINSIITRYRSL